MIIPFDVISPFSVQKVDGDFVIYESENIDWVSTLYGSRGIPVLAINYITGEKLDVQEFWKLEDLERLGAATLIIGINIYPFFLVKRRLR